MTFARTAIDSGSAGSSSTTISTAGYTSVAGRLIVGHVGFEDGDTTVAILDTAGNDYEVLATVPNGSNVVAGFYCLSSNGNASNVITATFGAARSVRNIQSAEYSKTGTAVFDGSASGSTSGVATTTTGNITTTGAVGLLFAGAKSYNSTTLGASGGMSLIAQVGNFSGDAERFLTSAGTYSASITNTTLAGVNVAAMAFKEGPPDPTVTSVTSSGVTEGGNMVFTVSLSGATTGSTNYGFGVTGTATAGTDYTSPLTSAMCSNSVTVSGSNFVAPTAVSSWTVTIPTTQDALDEDNETIVLTVGVTASTGGTITDDDASPALLIPGPVTVDSGDSVVASYTLGAVSGRVTYARLVLTDGTAVGGVNYTNTFPAATLSDGVTISAGVLSIPAGVTGFTITIPTT